MVIKSIFDEKTTEILREAGIVTPKPLKEAGDGNNLRDILDSNRLSLSDIVDQLAEIVHNESDKSVKLRAIDTSLKLHKVMDEPGAKNTSIVINIVPLTNRHEDRSSTIPAILLPRQIEIHQESL